MPSPAAAKESVTLYNELVHLDMVEQERIRAIAWRLRLLSRKRQHDLTIKVALLQALVMSGAAAEALVLSDKIWAARGQLPDEQRYTFADCLRDLGEFEKSLELVVGLAPSTDLPALITQNLVGSGDISALRESSKLSGGEPTARFLRKLEEKGIASHFADHQRIVNQHLRGTAALRHSFIVEAEEADAPELVNYAFADLDRDARRKLEDQIVDALMDYYRRSGLAGDVFIPELVVILLPLAAASMGLSEPRAA